MRNVLLLLPLVLVFVAAGCHSDDDGVDNAAVQKAQAPLIDAAKVAGGDWSKLTPDAQKQFLDRARGNEAAAKQMMGMMAGGPGGSAPKGPPAKR